MNESDQPGEGDLLGELSDCVTNAVNELAKLKGRGRIIWVPGKNHAYVIASAAKPTDLAINRPVRVETAGRVGFVQFENFTKQQLLDMLSFGEAEDIT